MTKISVIGVGYVGLPTAVGFAAKGNNVIAVTTTPSKAEMINKGKPPIYEQGLEKLLKRVLKSKKFRATTDMKDAIMKSDITFIAVGTPSDKKGKIDLSQIEKASMQIGEILREKKSYQVIVVKSTVVPGTTESIVLPAIEKSSGKKAGTDFGLAMNPEFLREGVALDDFLNADRIVIGAIDEKSASIIAKCYAKFRAPIVKTNTKTAELIKYTSNSLFATLVSFSNEMANISEKIDGIDNNLLFESVHLDKRLTINGEKAGIAHYIQSGCGYGGSCFPKDVNAIINHAENIGYSPKLLKEVKRINNERTERIIKNVEKIMKLKGKTVSLLGVAFKADTDDLRHSQALKLLSHLLNKNAIIKVYDPMAMKNLPELKNVIKCTSTREALDSADIAFIMTDWAEFKKLKENDFSPMRNQVVYDAKHILPPMKTVKVYTPGMAIKKN